MVRIHSFWLSPWFPIEPLRTLSVGRGLFDTLSDHKFTFSLFTYDQRFNLFWGISSYQSQPLHVILLETAFSCVFVSSVSVFPCSSKFLAIIFLHVINIHHPRTSQHGSLKDHVFPNFGKMLFLQYFLKMFWKCAPSYSDT